jgi:hypothetical protein
MAALALMNAFAWVHAHDFTCDTNQLQLSTEAASLDATTFCSGGWTEVRPGVKSSSFAMSGFWQAGADSVDAAGYTDLGVVPRVFTAGPVADEGQVAYLWRAGHFNYQLLGSHGELAPFSLTAAGADGYGVVRGKVAAEKQTKAATGVLGSVVELGAVAADEFLYASFHVFAAATTITVQVQSDEDGDFAAPTTRGTFGPLTTTGGVWMARVAGPITDTHYRLNVSAVTGSFQVAGAIAVGS